MRIVETVRLREKMKTDFSTLQMVARHEYRRLNRAIGLRMLTDEKIRLHSAYENFHHRPSLMTKEGYWREVLDYFGIE